MRTARAQSEVVGSILLVAVILLAVSTIGTIVLTELLSEEEPVSAVIDGQVTSEHNGTIELRHEGGDAIATTDLEVVVRNESTDWRLNFGDAMRVQRGDDDEYFEPGERWVNDSIDFGDERVRLMLVHTPTGTVLFDGRGKPGQWDAVDPIEFDAADRNEARPAQPRTGSTAVEPTIDSTK